MLKKIATAGMLTATIGGVLLTAGTAQADDNWSWKAHSHVKSGMVGWPVQECRSIGINRADVDQQNNAYYNHGRIDQDNKSNVDQDNRGCVNVIVIYH